MMAAQETNICFKSLVGLRSTIPTKNWKCKTNNSNKRQTTRDYLKHIYMRQTLESEEFGRWKRNLLCMKYKENGQDAIFNQTVCK